MEKCAEALGEVSDEITKLVRFFTTISSLGQHVVNVHVRSFGVAASNVFKQGEETSLTQKERQVRTLIHITDPSHLLGIEFG